MMNQNLNKARIAADIARQISGKIGYFVEIDGVERRLDVETSMTNMGVEDFQWERFTINGVTCGNRYAATNIFLALVYDDPDSMKYHSQYAVVTANKIRATFP